MPTEPSILTAPPTTPPLGILWAAHPLRAFFSYFCRVRNSIFIFLIFVCFFGAMPDACISWLQTFYYLLGKARPQGSLKGSLGKLPFKGSLDGRLKGHP
jgi:hypothetical protein